MERKDKFIDLGEIYLRGLQESDLSGNWYTWFNDPVVTRYQDKGFFANTREKQRIYYDHLIKSTSDIILAIILDSNDTHIGNIGLHKIDYLHRHAEIGIIIGEKDYWNKGFATKSICAIVDYAFKTHNLHKLNSLVMKENTGSMKAFENAGFEEEGMIKDYFFKHGAYHDVVLWGKINKKD
jgi:RimJ/RimL family protein N-acetyltransferase